MRPIDADAVPQEFWEYEFDGKWRGCTIKDLLDFQPTIHPEPHWIPVTERMPEKGQYVLCQCRAGIMDVLRLTDDNGWYKDSTHIYMHVFVLAWMPLPEAYKEGAET